MTLNEAWIEIVRGLLTEFPAAALTVGVAALAARLHRHHTTDEDTDDDGTDDDGESTREHR